MPLSSFEVSEQISHAMFNDILDELGPELGREDLRYFQIRLGANFCAFLSLLAQLYRGRDDFFDQTKALVERLARAHTRRPRSRSRT